jgi:DNA-binding NarL/FixJ family response regulator
MTKFEPHTDIKVTIADDHPMVISGLTNMLRPFRHIKVISHFTSGNDLLEGLTKALPHVILMDIMMPGLQGPELARKVKELHPEIKILAVTSLDTPGQIRNMMQSGCSGYLLKNTDQDILVDAIEKTFAGEEFIEPALKEQLVQSILRFKEKNGLKQQTDKVVLTRREKEILQLIIQENSNQEIADKLFVSLRTVENHRFNLQQKLQVKNMIGLVKVAIQMGLA